MKLQNVFIFIIFILALGLVLKVHKNKQAHSNVNIEDERVTRIDAEKDSSRSEKNAKAAQESTSALIAGQSALSGKPGSDVKANQPKKSLDPNSRTQQLINAKDVADLAQAQPSPTIAGIDVPISKFARREIPLDKSKLKFPNMDPNDPTVQSMLSRLPSSRTVIDPVPGEITLNLSEVRVVNCVVPKTNMKSLVVRVDQTGNVTDLEFLDLKSTPPVPDFMKSCQFYPARVNGGPVPFVFTLPASPFLLRLGWQGRIQ